MVPRQNIRNLAVTSESAREKEAVSIIEKAKSYIRDNYKKDISLDEVSREVDISPYYFSKLF